MDPARQRAEVPASSNQQGRKSTVDHWNAVWSQVLSRRLPSSLNVSVWDLKRLLKRYLKPGCAYMELGCAPGKMLAWTAVALGARVSGLDYSGTGVEATRRLFGLLHLQADIREEDIFHHSFCQSSFDVVGSYGLIEHFDDPREIIRKHVELVKPGGIALIVVPDYLGLYGRLQQRFDPENLAIHNTKIMNPDVLSSLAPDDLAGAVRVYRDGRVCPWLVSLHKKIPPPLAKGISYFLNLCGLLQPFTIQALCWMVVLEITRK